MLAIDVAQPVHATDLAALARDTFSETFLHYPPAHLAVFLSRYTPAYFEGLLRDPAQRLWMVSDDDKVIGYAHAGPCGLPHPDVTAGCGELKRLYIRKGAQNSGTGGALFREALAWLNRPGRKVWLGVYSENHGAQRFYARHGFRKVGEYEFVVGDTRDREFIFRRG